MNWAFNSHPENRSLGVSMLKCVRKASVQLVLLLFLGGGVQGEVWAGIEILRTIDDLEFSGLAKKSGAVHVLSGTSYNLLINGQWSLNEQGFEIAISEQEVFQIPQGSPAFSFMEMNFQTHIQNQHIQAQSGFHLQQQPFYFPQVMGQIPPISSHMVGSPGYTGAGFIPPHMFPPPGPHQMPAHPGGIVFVPVTSPQLVFNPQFNPQFNPEFSPEFNPEFNQVQPVIIDEIESDEENEGNNENKSSSDNEDYQKNDLGAGAQPDDSNLTVAGENKKDESDKDENSEPSIELTVNHSPSNDDHPVEEPPLMVAGNNSPYSRSSDDKTDNKPQSEDEEELDDQHSLNSATPPPTPPPTPVEEPVNDSPPSHNEDKDEPDYLTSSSSQPDKDGKNQEKVEVKPSGPQSKKKKRDKRSANPHQRQGNKGGQSLRNQSKKKNQNKPNEVSEIETPGSESVVAGLSVGMTAKCCDRNGQGKAPGWFRKNVSKLSDFFVEQVKKLGRFLSRKPKKSATKPVILLKKKAASIRSSGRISSTPLRSVVKVVVGGVLFATGIGITLWYWRAMDHSEAKAMDHSDSIKDEPADELASVDVQCKGDNVSRDYSMACESLLGGDQHRAAQLIMQSAKVMTKDQPHPVFSIFHQSGPLQNIYRKTLPDKLEGLVYGEVGYLDWPGLKVKHQPYFRMAEGVVREMLESLSVKLTRRFSDEQLELASMGGLDVLSQAILWCGFPLGKPAKKVHGNCFDWLIEQVSESSDWYQHDMHRVYYLQQLSRVTPPEDVSYLGFSPLYHLDQAGLSGFLEYENRKLKAASKELIVMNSPILQRPANPEGLVPDHVEEPYDLFVSEGHERWHKVLSSVISGQPVKFIPGRVYGLSDQGGVSPKRLLVSNGQQLIEWDEQKGNAKAHTQLERPRPAKKRLFNRQSGLSPVVSIEQQNWHFMTEYPRISGVSFLGLYHLVYWVVFSQGGSAVSQAVTGSIVSFMALLQWQILSNYYAQAPDDRTLVRYQKLSDLFVYFQKNRDLNKLNMLLALSMNPSLPLGMMEYREKDGVVSAKDYLPFAEFDLKKKVKAFNHSFISCQKHFKGCSADYQEHVEFIRFHMAVCGEGLVNGCEGMWEDLPSRRAWLGLVHSVDWQDKAMSLMPDPGRGGFTITPSFEAQPGGYRFAVAYHALASIWIGQNQLFEVDGRFRCQPSSLQKGMNSDEAVQCRVVGNKTYLDFKGSAHLLLLPEFDQKWERVHWLSFMNGNLLDPVWKRQAQWQVEHVQGLSGSLDSPELVANLTQSVIPLRQPQDAEGTSNAFSSGSVFLMDDKGHYVGSDLDFCNRFEFENLRLACIAYPLDLTLRKYFLQLDNYAENKQWVAFFNQQREATDKAESLLSVVDIRHFNTLSVERLLWHIEFLKDDPELGTQANVDAIMAYAGVIAEDNPEVAMGTYRKLYKVMMEGNVAERFKENQSARCYMKRLSEGKWCSQEDACLTELPSWILKGASLSLDSEVKLVRKDKLYRAASKRYNDHFSRVRLDRVIKNVGVDAVKSADSEFLMSDVPVKKVEGVSDAFDVSVEGVPLLIKDKDKDVIEAMFILQEGHLYQGACDSLSMTLQKEH
ncbi:hypothetical protein [Endozoicomonas arenosclerae]|uniref:hypothetical protein n=1 Tax=Endozoicomonas arenosclerae TaxID=1633495 RepID=UPI000780C447|nr:hypothetical protein [Endozoicomonas arenosclerae]